MSDYLSRALSQRVAEVQKSSGRAMDIVMAQAAAAGGLASGSTLLQFTERSLTEFERAYLDAQQFAFNLIGAVDDEIVGQLQECASRMIDAIMAEVTERSNRLGIQGSIVPNQLSVSPGIVE
jgi:hypothetical protein